MTLDLARFPRATLGVWPTPLQDAPRLGEVAGAAVLLKRDDVNPLGAAGNKLRKLEFLLGAAVAEGADTVVTFGAVQTNHGRQTAAACARLGLRCELVLTAKVPRAGAAYDTSGNVLLDHLFSARVHVCRDAGETAAAYERVRAEAEADGRRLATIPVGGSDSVGSLGYVAAAVELAGQLADRGVDAARVLVPMGSGGTAAGLAVGFAALGVAHRVDVGCVGMPADETAAEVTRLAGETARLLGVDAPPPEHIRYDDTVFGPGYGVPTERGWAALRTFGRTEGVVLEPVYTGKAAASLLDGRYGGEDVVFVHTGGMPGLFAYAPEAVDALA
ncbi:1-aminocyclopropane-1-carboxylate deaminase [Amycolatopsis antarctica]|uniref:1-aminocyclopropane-1-carboxylate deaminase n=1 Tax=Amycolatopsis antarctica TaxID=1854586 RepID=A0A263CWP8_9PSEU|nr:D-cysteine desulfhydrase family protein [Amycolatopsis antarctica]OZM70399.1 1-aminocyclopropane-1-carboxylate deaminase [Amycolatopsis antarctica]